MLGGQALQQFYHASFNENERTKTENCQRKQMLTSFFFQLSRFQFSLLVFSVFAIAVSFMFQSFQNSSLVCVHFMYMSVIFYSCDLVFCFILTTRLYACHVCSHTSVLSCMYGCMVSLGSFGSSPTIT